MAAKRLPKRFADLMKGAAELEHCEGGACKRAKCHGEKCRQATAEVAKAEQVLEATQEKSYLDSRKSARNGVHANGSPISGY